jgi:hypothetical protein
LPAAEIYFDIDLKNLASIRSGSSYFKSSVYRKKSSPLARFDEAKVFDRPKGLEGRFEEDFMRYQRMKLVMS